MATEVAKNLLLSNFKKITIVDDAAVEACDIQQNIFLATKSCGKNEKRAQLLANALSTLNGECSVTFNTLSLRQIITNPSFGVLFLKAFNVVVICESLPATASIHVNHIKHLCKLNNILSFEMKSIAYFGCISRISMPRFHYIVDHKQEYAQADEFLRCLLFEEMLRYCNSISLDVENIDAFPFPVLLIKCFQESLDSKIRKFSFLTLRNASSYFIGAMKEKLLALSNKHPHAKRPAEAIQKLQRLLQLDASVIPAGLQRFLLHATENTFNNEDLYLFGKGVRKFVAKKNRIPIYAGILPDVDCDTDQFLKLKSVYEAQQKKDTRFIHNYITKRALPKKILRFFVQKCPFFDAFCESESREREINNEKMALFNFVTKFYDENGRVPTFSEAISSMGKSLIVNQPLYDR